MAHERDAGQDALPDERRADPLAPPSLVGSHLVGRCLVCWGPLREEVHLVAQGGGGLALRAEWRVVCDCGPHVIE